MYIVQDPFSTTRFISQQDFTHLWNIFQDLFWVARWSTLLNSFTLSWFFGGSRKWLKPTTSWVSCKKPPSCAHFNICLEQHGSPVYEIVFTLFFLSFFGGPGLSIPDQSWVRDSVGEADSIVVQLLVTHLLYTVQDLLAQQDSPVSETVFTLFSFFWWTKS